MTQSPLKELRMNLFNYYLRNVLSIVILAGLITSIQADVPEWYARYKAGLEAQERGDWQAAAENFQAALKLKDDETTKTRAYGTIFIEYFPHRELGISYYHLGNVESARKELEYSVSKRSTLRAKEYLDGIEAGQPPLVEEKSTEVSATAASGAAVVPAVPPETESSSLVGERLSLAVLPFESKGIGKELGQIDLFDKLVAAFVNTRRFKVFERAELQKILEEQQLGASGVIDISTAARFGRGIGVDAVVVGSFTEAGNSASIDARLIDTETTAIISAKDAFSNSTSLSSLSNMITEMASKVTEDLPIVYGYVIRVDGSKVIIDMGYTRGIKKGMKCHVYREGAPLVHPVTGEVISKTITEVCEIQITELFDVYSVAEITKTKNGDPLMRDRVITK